MNIIIHPFKAFQITNGDRKKFTMINLVYSKHAHSFTSTYKALCVKTFTARYIECIMVSERRSSELHFTCYVLPQCE
jgi:hypothetical protein